MFFCSHSSHCSAVKELEMPFSTSPLKRTVGETWMPTRRACYKIVSTFYGQFVPQISYLDQQLEVSSDLITNIRVPITIWLIGHFEQIIDLTLRKSNCRRKLGQALVSSVPSLVDHVDIKVVGLLVKESSAKVPKLGWVGFEHSNSSFVNQSRRWMPGLHLLAEDDLDFGGVFLLDQRKNRVVDCVEHLLGELYAAVSSLDFIYFIRATC